MSNQDKKLSANFNKCSFEDVAVLTASSIFFGTSTMTLGVVALSPVAASVAAPVAVPVAVGIATVGAIISGSVAVLKAIDLLKGSPSADKVKPAAAQPLTP